MNALPEAPYQIAAQLDAELLYGKNITVKFSRTTKSAAGRRLYFLVYEKEEVIDELIFCVFSMEKIVKEKELQSA